MGAESVSPYLYPNATLQDWERGVNFASAGAGILLDTGYLFVSSTKFIGMSLLLLSKSFC